MLCVKVRISSFGGFFVDKWLCQAKKLCPATLQPKTTFGSRKITFRDAHENPVRFLVRGLLPLGRRWYLSQRRRRSALRPDTVLIPLSACAGEHPVLFFLCLFACFACFRKKRTEDGALPAVTGLLTDVSGF